MRQVYTERDIPDAGELCVLPGAIFTPSARDLVQQRRITVIEAPAEEIAKRIAPNRTIAVGSDHGGFRMKQFIVPLLRELGLSVKDVGVFDEGAADYPDIAVKVASLVQQGVATRGVIVDGAGIGSAMAANKMAGIRAALCYDVASARNSREHNDANVLTLGGRLLTDSQAETVLRTWLATPFAGGRHKARVDKIMALEQRSIS